MVSFASGDPELARHMFSEIQRLVPDRRHFLVKPGDFSAQSTLEIYRQLRKRFRAYRIGQAPLLLDRDPKFKAFRRAAFLLAPTKILAYNATFGASPFKTPHSDRFIAVRERRSARSDLSTSKVACSLEERSVRLSIWGPGDPRKGAVPAPPPYRGREPLFSLPARARRSRADLQFVARNVGRVRHLSLCVSRLGKIRGPSARIGSLCARHSRR